MEARFVAVHPVYLERQRSIHPRLVVSGIALWTSEGWPSGAAREYDHFAQVASIVLCFSLHIFPRSKFEYSVILGVMIPSPLRVVHVYFPRE